MSSPAWTRLFEHESGVASLVQPAFVQQALLWAVLLSGSLALLHVVLGLVRGRLPLALFCLLGALASVAAGLFVTWDTLLENARRSASAAALWWPGFTLGFFVTGAVCAALWAATTVPLARLLRRAPPTDGS